MKLLNLRQTLQRPMAEKWTGKLPNTYVPDWSDVWKPARPQKEAGFLWFIYHKAVAVNSWRAQIVPRDQLLPPPNPSCICCPSHLPETVLHRFFSCTKTQVTWAYD
jgi:hypothetical protein